MASEIKIGQALKRLLFEERKTLKEVSRDTGIPYSTLHTWLLNRQPKNILGVAVVAAYFNISLEELLFDKAQIHAKADQAQTIQLPSPDSFCEGRFELTVRRIK